MLSKESTRAAPAGIRRDPQDDRLVGAINTASSTSVETAATAAHPNDGWWGSGAARVGDMTPQITLIKKCGPNPLMSKKIFVDEQGKLQSDGSQCVMVQGTATRLRAATASDLATIISDCCSDEAIALGSLKDGLPNSVPITVLSKIKDNAGAISRSREFIDYHPGTPAWALIDFDTKGMPAHIAARIEAEGGMWNVLLTVASGLARAARISRASTSSGLFHLDTGEPLPGSGGLHVELLLRERGDTERFP